MDEETYGRSTIPENRFSDGVFWAGQPSEASRSARVVTAANAAAPWLFSSRGGVFDPNHTGGPIIFPPKIFCPVFGTKILKDYIMCFARSYNSESWALFWIQKIKIKSLQWTTF